MIVCVVLGVLATVFVILVIDIGSWRLRGLYGVVVGCFVGFVVEKRYFREDVGFYLSG